MTRISDEFEKQIARIHSLIEQEGSEVIWNDRILDPDNPVQMRQIDVTIRRDGALTLVECRIHKEPQDVTWIEELIGRRVSLHADAVIAVSASGFTSGAIQKARTHGIILRDMVSLTQEEIWTWGHRTDVHVTFYKFEDISLVFEFDPAYRGRINLEDIGRALLEGRLAIAPVFDKLVEEVRARNPKLKPMRVSARVSPMTLSIGDIPVKGILVDLAFSTVRQDLSVAAVVAYDVPEAGALERNAYVEQVELGRFEIAQSSDIASVAMDLSVLEIPDECKFGGVGFKFSRPGEMREAVFLGYPDFGIRIGPSQVGVRFC